MLELIEVQENFISWILEMSFVEQEDVFKVVEKLMIRTFKRFSKNKILFEKFPRITFSDAIEKYGTDKPDLRNPLVIKDITNIFSSDDIKFEIFKKLVKSGQGKNNNKNTKKINPGAFFDNIDRWAKEQGSFDLRTLLLKRIK